MAKRQTISRSNGTENFSKPTQFRRKKNSEETLQLWRCFSSKFLFFRQIASILHLKFLLQQSDY
ncbi:hypothetical protein [Pseudomonas abietaniphila]|uniref:hypothetical protein n=1 Tax=Pseudomonas abietaniphila TaxID=89065 RepID=UPI001428CEBB|nr:hypothetical protein [Pseudomonas abietaniphila]